jgi:hypothetical protein
MPFLLEIALASFGILVLASVLIPLVAAARLDGRPSAGVA